MLIRPNWLESRGLVGVMGVFVVIISVVASLGVIAMVGIPFGPSLIQVTAPRTHAHVQTHTPRLLLFRSCRSWPWV